MLIAVVGNLVVEAVVDIRGQKCLPVLEGLTEPDDVNIRFCKLDCVCGIRLVECVDDSNLCLPDKNVRISESVLNRTGLGSGVPYHQNPPRHLLQPHLLLR